MNSTPARLSTASIVESVARPRRTFQLRRDWGFATEYTEGIISIMNHREADTFVLATGKNASVREFVELAFRAAQNTNRSLSPRLQSNYVLTLYPFGYGET
jgi:GDP-mannose 4,6 dehydratase